MSKASEKNVKKNLDAAIEVALESLSLETAIEMALKSVTEANQYTVKFEKDKSKNPGWKALRALANYSYHLGVEHGYEDGLKDGKKGNDQRVKAHLN